MGVTSRRRTFAAVALVATAALATAACSKSPSPGGTTAPENITLSVEVFGNFGYTEAGLYAAYHAAHPNITIKETGTGQGLGDENTKLDGWLAAGGAGASDIVALEEGTITKYKASAASFANLLDYPGVSDLKGNFLDWKWQQGLTSSGQLLGLGTDVGSLGMCYRKDLFAKAGLPTDRDAVAKLWPTWQDYITVGKQFVAKNTGAKFLDAATNTYNAILTQTAGQGTGYTYFDKSDKLVIDSNPDIKSAWDTTVAIVNAKLSANLNAFSDDWNKAFGTGAFATIACPAWMLGYIQGQAKDAGNGKWDVTTAPGGGGNWGGSFLAVPKTGKHVAEAVKLAQFLTNPASQLAVFKALGNLPSAPADYDDPSFQATKNDYFGGAPTGVIFGGSAKALKPLYLGGKNQVVRSAVEDALRSFEQGKRTADQAWQDAIANGTKAAQS
jgi:cellobiose transport system substrate-binding protein